METPTPLNHCATCGKPLSPEKLARNAKFCSKTCCAAQVNKFKKSAYPNLVTGTVGALHELMVACDLMRRGFALFRALSPSCSCDMVMLSGGKAIRIEVTTGYYNEFHQKVVHPNKDESRFDLLAVVHPNGIYYKPDISQFTS
jgi:hypothetical protein